MEDSIRRLTGMLRRSAVLAGFGLVALVQAFGLAALQGRVESRTFTGPITGKTLRYSIYLPQGYDAGTARYPVVYHLHGIGDRAAGSRPRPCRSHSRTRGRKG